jgi:hypothetical protein
MERSWPGALERAMKESSRRGRTVGIIAAGLIATLILTATHAAWAAKRPHCVCALPPVCAVTPGHPDVLPCEA